MRRALFLGALIGVLATAAGTAAASDPIILPTGQEGCVSPAGDTCAYTTTRDGGYVADGDTWTLQVEIAADGDPRDTNEDGLLRYVFDSSNAPEQGCGLWETESIVTVDAGASGGIAAGNPFLAATDELIGDANDCEAGKITADNPSYSPAD